MTAKEIANMVGGTLFGDESAVVTSAVRDNREVCENALFFAIRGEHFDANTFSEDALSRGASCVVGQREFAPEKGAVISVPDTKKAMGDLARAICEKMGVPAVAVTGSVGKTTTKDMIDCALSVKYSTHKTPENFNNDIGLPLTVFGASDETQLLILEMGMNHAGELSYLAKIARPSVAVITNIGLCHIENLGSQENILKAKLEILEGLRENGAAVLNADDPFLWNEKDTLGVRAVWYGMENKKADIFGTIEGENLRVGDTLIHMPAPGVHNMMNALASVAVAKELGISADDAARGIECYESTGNRQNILTTHQGALLLSDCYNASPAAVKAALGVLKNFQKKRKIAVLGDMFELGDFAPDAHFSTGKEVAEQGIDLLLTVGALSRETARGAKESGMETVISFDTNEEAISYLEEHLTEDDALLVKGSHGMHMETISNKLAR